jgi:hypothetical protein
MLYALCDFLTKIRRNDMRKRMKRILPLYAVSILISCFLFVSISFSQEMPKPGQVIDKSNYKQYAHVFPEEILPGFENGFGGFWKPFVIKVVESKPASQPKAFLALSEKNRGKYTIDKDGFIAGGYDYIGLPFPGVTPDDKDFGAKFMYNHNYRYYWGDDAVGASRDAEKRKGESVTNLEFDEEMVSFVGRLIDPPKPFYKNPGGIQSTQLLAYTYPSSYRGQVLLTYKYLDQKKSDEVYIYLPTMRRVIRGDASQRSTPIQGTTQAWDDFNGFDGKVQEFTYQFLGQKKVLGCLTSPFTTAVSKKLQAEGGGTLPYSSENWEVRDTYVIEIKAKDPKYPQKTKVVYIDKDTLMILYAFAWDRAEKLWKAWYVNYSANELPNGDKVYTIKGALGIDVQIGYATFFTMDTKSNGNGLKYVDVMPSNMYKKSR